MPISVFDLFSIGIGPSSSHTVGPMRAARRFTQHLNEKGLFTKTESVKVELFGSLALTGKGHGTDKAVLLGLEGHTPEGVDPTYANKRPGDIQKEGLLHLLGEKHIPFSVEHDLLFLGEKRLPFHSNAVRFIANDKNKIELLSEIFYSVGGGFIVDHATAMAGKVAEDTHLIPYPFATGKELLAKCAETKLSIRDLMLANEKTWCTEKEIGTRLMKIWTTMQDVVSRGCKETGILPGGLLVKRRAPQLHDALMGHRVTGHHDPSEIMDWVSLYALATSEENASGGRIVTAPTNGAAGILPAVMHYYHKHVSPLTEEEVITFFLTAGAIGILYKLGASLSGAEVGCQGEVGVACSMAAGGLAALSGGSVEQVENAAEIGMEHNLGLTCDPVRGLVQIPCIERNTMGAVKAINASRLAMRGDGTHIISLDKVIGTMRQTGADMQSIYKETSLGGLAVNSIEC